MATIFSGGPPDAGPSATLAAIWARALLDVVTRTRTGAALCDETGRVEWVNDAIVRMTGVGRDELIGRHPDELFVRPADESDDAFRAAIARGEPVLRELRRRARDGRTLVLEVELHPLRGDDGRVARLFCLVHDVTQLRERTAALAESERRLRDAERIAGVGHWELTLATGEIFWSDELYRIHGLEPGSVPASDELLFSQIDAPSRARARAAAEAALVASAPIDLELRIVRPDGAPRDVLSRICVERRDGAPERLFGTTLDITERKRAEEAQVASERRFRQIIETAPLATVALDPAGVVTFANPALASLLGRTTDQIVGARWFESFVPVDQHEVVLPMFDEILRSGRAPEQFDNDVVVLGGARRTVRWRTTVLRDAAGAAIGTLSFGEDITERLHLEEQRRTLMARMQQAQKMEAIGRLAGGVAHDFNNILTAIRSCTELLRDLCPEPGQAELLQEIEVASGRATELTRRLLAFGRRQIVAPRRLDPRAVVVDLEEMLRPLLGEDVALVVRATGDVPVVRADRGQIEQLLTNLAINAREAMPEGGTLRIEVDGVTLGPDDLRTRAELSPGRFARIRVIDTGIGMADEVRERIFEPFFTTRATGSGLGLATAFAIASQHGGALGVESAPGCGATFELLLPAAAEGAERVAAPAPAARRVRETILVAEDEASVRRVLVRALRAWGYEVLEAADGIEALALAGAFVGPIDALLTDVLMPGLDGRQLAEALAHRRPGLRVLFVSGHTNDAVLRRGVQDDRVAFLHKPFTPRELAAKLREVLCAPTG